MKRILKSFTAILVCLLLHQTYAVASSHREAPLISNDPLADNTDVYAFRSPCDDSKVVLIANYIPFEHPAGGPNWYTFGENIRYEIHVKNSATTTTDDITYRFTFTHANQDWNTFFLIRLGQENIKTTYTLEKGVNGVFTTIVSNGKVPPPNIGPRSIENATVGLGAANYDALINSSIMSATGSGGEKVFAGPADDPFFVDLGGAFDVGGFRPNGRDGLNKMNVHSICIEVPISTLQSQHHTVAQAVNILDSSFVIGVWASASRREITTRTAGNMEPAASGNWVQVSRLGMPLTNEVINPLMEKDKWNATSPYGMGELSFAKNFKNPELGLYMDDSQYGTAVPGLKNLRIQTHSLKTASDSGYDFRNGKKGLYRLKGNPALVGTALDPATYGNILLPDSVSPRAVDILPIFYTGVPNAKPYQLATGKAGNPLAAGKPFINNFLPTLGDMLRLNMAVPVTPRSSPKFSTLGLVGAAVLGLTDTAYTNYGTMLQNIPNMDGFPNGRRLEDDVTTIELQAVGGVVLAAIGLWYDDYTPGVSTSPVTQQLGNVLSFQAGVTKNDTTLKACFPYVQGPWRGFTGPQYAGAAPCGAPTDRLYVNGALGTSGSGSSWDCGLKEFSEAVKIANANPAIKSIWVAKGTYTPGMGRNDHFEINRADLDIVGGFAGGETMASQANPLVNVTIISGEIGAAGRTDNSYVLFVLRSIPTTTSSTRLMIENLAIQDAYAASPSSGNGGAVIALYTPSSTPVTFKKCNFNTNYASGNGGAFYLDNAPLQFDSCFFISNTANQGGAIYGFQSSPVLTNCVFQTNNAVYGGGFYANYGDGTFNKCVFIGNTGTFGAAIFQNRYNITCNNSVFTGNAATIYAGAIYANTTSLAVVRNSTFYANSAANAGGAIVVGNARSRVEVYNSIFYNNTRNGSSTIQFADVLNSEEITTNVFANDALQPNTHVAADNGSNIRNNVRGLNPAFTNPANPIGADLFWGTGDDGLQLSNSSPVRNIGSNAQVPAGTDIANQPRIACSIVDLGAYENQVCTPFTSTPDQPAIAAAVVNPFHSSLDIRYNNEERARITVISANGKILTQVSNAPKGVTRVDASNWSTGMYQVEIVTASGKKSSFKVIKM